MIKKAQPQQIIQHTRTHARTLTTHTHTHTNSTAHQRTSTQQTHSSHHHTPQHTTSRAHIVPLLVTFLMMYGKNQIAFGEKPVQFSELPAFKGRVLAHPGRDGEQRIRVSLAEGARETTHFKAKQQTHKFDRMWHCKHSSCGNMLDACFSCSFLSASLRTSVVKACICECICCI